jgi:predicted GNAT superfamily acetyltransferase
MSPGEGEVGDRHRVRELEGRGELVACVALQEEIWGPGFDERVPPSILEVARRTGGVVAGAFGASGKLDAFVFGLTGWVDGGPLHWSDMLGVRPELRDAGLGTRLKAHQRRRCLEQGITRMVWTYDPLEARNGWVNLMKLGAVARRYIRDLYGPGDSPLHRGLGTDRLLVEWELAGPGGSPETRGGRDAEELPRPPRAFSVREGVPEPEEPVRVETLPVRVPVPRDIQALKRSHPEVARAWRRSVRSALEAALESGGVVAGMIRPPDRPVVDLVVRRAASRS